MRSFLLLLAFLLALAGSAAAQSSRNPRLLTPAELQADVRILRKALEQVHPQLYRYTDNPTFDRAFAALEGDVQQGTAEGEFFRRVSQIAVLAHCGHTWTNPLNQEKGLVERVFDRPHFLPFYFRLVNRRMIVTHNASDNLEVTAGTEIRKINNVAVPKIIDALLTIGKSDGRNTVAHRLRTLEVRRTSADARVQDNLFDLFFPLFFPLRGCILFCVSRPDGNTSAERNR